jgi:hypothetical protein
MDSSQFKLDLVLHDHTTEQNKKIADRAVEWSVAFDFETEK